MKKVLRARKGGFTLVELLIVIIIIAILAGMMLLTTGSATDGAEASKLVNNLRSLKSAMLLHYLDNDLKWYYSSVPEDIGDELSKYMDRSLDIDKYRPEILSADSDESRFIIGFTSNSGIFTSNPGVKNKLKGMAGSAGLFDDTGDVVYNGSGGVYMYVR